VKEVVEEVAEWRPRWLLTSHFSPLGNARAPRCENLFMKRHLTQPARETAGHAVPSADFAQLPSVLTSREAASVLRVGVREVRALVDSGQLPGTRVGPRKVVRISRAAVLALLRVQSAG